MIALSLQYKNRKSVSSLFLLLLFGACFLLALPVAICSELRKPTVHLSTSRISAAPGQLVVINCSIDGFNRRPVWYFNNHPRTDAIESDPALAPSAWIVIPRLRANDTGVYWCVLLGDSGDCIASKSAAVSILGDDRDAVSLSPSAATSPASLSPCPPSSTPPTRPGQQHLPSGHSIRPRAKRQSGPLTGDQLPPDQLNDENSNNNARAQASPSSASLRQPPQLSLPWQRSGDTMQLAARHQLPQQLAAKVGRLPAPNASSIGDNLAVNISWLPVKTADFYRIQMRSKLSAEKRWSQPFQLDEMVTECCTPASAASPSADECCHLPNRRIYLTNRQPAGLEPGRVYQFSVQALSHLPADSSGARQEPGFPGTRNPLGGEPAAFPLALTHWSKPVSFEHISRMAPVITEAKRLTDGAILVKWSLTKYAVGFPIDHFLLLHRAEERLDNGRLVYQGFHSVVVHGRDTTEYKLEGLTHSKGYQIVVYGVHAPPPLIPEATVFTGGQNGRRITMFSHEVFVNPTPKAPDSPKAPGVGDKTVPGADTKQAQQQPIGSTDLLYTPLHNHIDSNRLMFMILGALAGLMLLVMVVLVVVCICRQQREKRLQTGHLAAEQRQKRVKSASMNSRHNAANPSGRFMLDQLTPADNREDLMNEPQSRRASLMPYHAGQHQPYHLTHPPPVNPAPPPPPPEHMALISQSEAFQMIGCAANQSQDVMGANVIGPGMTVNPIGQPDAMTTLPAYHAAGGNHMNMRLLPPYNMKREPPSGGSVHEETDNENDPMSVHPPSTSVCLVYRNPKNYTPYYHPSQSGYGPRPPPGAYPPPDHLDLVPLGVTNRIYYPPSSDSLANAFPQPNGHQLAAVWLQSRPVCPTGYPGQYTPAFGQSRPQSVTADSGDCRPGSRDLPGRLQDKLSYRPTRHRSVPPPMGARGPLSSNSPSPVINGQGAELSVNGDNTCQQGETTNLTNGFQHEPLMSSSPRESIHASDLHDPTVPQVPYSSHQEYGLPVGGHMEYRLPPRTDYSDQMMSAMCVDQPGPGAPPGHYGPRLPESYWVTDAHNNVLVCQGYPMTPPIPAHRMGSAVSPLAYGQCNPATLLEQQQQSLCQGVPRVRDYSEYGIPNVAGYRQQPGVMSPPPPPPYVNYCQSNTATATYRHPVPPLPFHATNASRLARA